MWGRTIDDIDEILKNSKFSAKKSLNDNLNDFEYDNAFSINDQYTKKETDTDNSAKTEEISPSKREIKEFKNDLKNEEELEHKKSLSHRFSNKMRNGRYGRPRFFAFKRQQQNIPQYFRKRIIKNGNRPLLVGKRSSNLKSEKSLDERTRNSKKENNNKKHRPFIMNGRKRDNVKQINVMNDDNVKQNNFRRGDDGDILRPLLLPPTRKRGRPFVFKDDNEEY